MSYVWHVARVYIIINVFYNRAVMHCRNVLAPLSFTLTHLFLSLYYDFQPSAFVIVIASLPGVHKGQKWTSDPLELELWTLVSHHAGGGD